MARSLFDPSKMRGPDPPPPPSKSDAPISVTLLTSMIDGALRDTLPKKLRVTGEISSLNCRTHYYFDLKDDAAVVSCVMFASAARSLVFKPESGMQVVATGAVQHYAPQGRTQLYVTKLEEAGLGELDRKFRELCAQLREQGYFAPERKRPLPTFPRRIAIVTSETGAALQDVINTVQRRCPAVELLVVDVRVQGERAAPQIAKTINAISKRRDELAIDAVILTRGGGSMEDLWAFNEKTVADAVLRCAVPIVAAIGHETDTTIAELVADERCATPTQAAMRLTPDRAALGEQLSMTHRRLARASGRAIEIERSRTDSIARFFADPGALVRIQRDRCTTLQQNLTGIVTNLLNIQAARTAKLDTRLQTHHPRALFAQRRARIDRAAARMEVTSRFALRARIHRLSALTRELAVVSPLAVLDRGYSLTTLPSGEILRTAAAATPGVTLNTRLADGSLTSQVLAADTAPKRSKPPPLPPRRGKRKNDPSQMDLF